MKHARLIIMIALALLTLAACAGADVKNDVAASGRKAEDFTLPDQDGKMWTLAETLKDYKAVVLAFYPKDDTGA
ncbi:MAG: redoxin domain-containing protein [Syntrophaceae bacterium]|jgi:cytochrome oxidase Cu insertion factor (SCO1/SenC/PrrC family)|nr:redoxin domain-containing protein [Syntrophaceae bacterium]